MVATNVMALPVPLPSMGLTVATMGLIQEHSPSHNIDQFNYENILRDTT